MHLARVKVENHSRLQDLELEVRRHMVLIGPNDVGKSSLLRCLNLLLGASTAQLYNQITLDDLRDPGLPLSVEADLCGFSDDEKALFADEITVDPTGEAELTLTVRLEATFDDNETLSINRTVPNKNIGRQISREQLRAIGWTLLNANDRARTLDDDRRTLLDEVLAGVELGDEQDRFDNLLGAIGEQLQNSNVLSDLRGQMSSQLSTALPERIDRDDLTFIPGAIANDDVLNGVRLQVHGKSIGDQSDGKRALYAIALYDLVSNGANIVAIDEPEIHLHPSSQRSLARLLKDGDNQKIIATHSSDIVSAFDPELIVSVRDGGRVIQPTSRLLDDDQRAVLRWWVRNKLEPLTARHVVAVEGIADRIILERVAELTGRDLDRLGVSVIEAEGAGDMGVIWKLFGEDGFNAQLSVLIDRDAVEKTSKSIGVEERDFKKRSIWVSERDLEEEYSKAFDAEHLWDAMQHSGAFSRNELSNVKRTGANASPTGADLANFLRSKSKYKTQGAIMVANILDKTTASRITSIMNLLDDIESA